MKFIFWITVVSLAIYFFALKPSTDPLAGPVRGSTGLQKAIEIHNETKQPMVVWSTWEGCSACAKVGKWFSSHEVTGALEGCPMVILESRGTPEECDESARMGFKGGNFYIIRDYRSKRSTSIRAWEKGSYTIKKNLLSQLESRVK